MEETRRKFGQDFKEGAVRLVRETGKPIAQVARELGVNEGTLGNWVGADRKLASTRVRSSIRRDDRSPACHRVHQQRHQHLRVIARPALTRARAGLQSRGIQLPDHVNQEPDKMVLSHPRLHIQGQEHRLLPVHREVLTAHEPILPGKTPGKILRHALYLSFNLNSIEVVSYAVNSLIYTIAV